MTLESPTFVAIVVPRLDGPIRANRLADSRESPHSRESPEACRAEPLLANRVLGH